MMDSLLQEANALFPNSPLLTIDEVANLLKCETTVIYHWTKRSDPKRRPPRIIVGKSLRFPKTDFIR